MNLRYIPVAVLCLGALAETRQAGPAVGARIPDFSTKDQNGRVQTFQSLRGPKGLLLLFARSADWCVYCKAELVELEQKKAEYQSRGLNVAAITYDSPALLHQFAGRKGITFPLLGDPASEIIRAFGVLDTSLHPGDFGYGVPLQGTYLIDEHGVVRSRYVEDNHTRHYTAGNVLMRQFADTKGAFGSTVETRQLELTSSASDASPAPGSRLALILDIELKPAMHLYAPGVEGGYIAVDWQIPDSKVWTVQPVAYPPSTKLHLPAINETVPVYKGHLRLVRDLTIGSNQDLKTVLGANRDLTIPGTFRYQACDDRMCYAPKNLPLKWTFQIAPLDSVRAPAELQRK